jgi:REP element-mobilizing transposase RayT
MTVARSDIVDDSASGVYHCVARCVRRAFLCGQDPYTGRNYEHRKAWVQDRLRTLAESFGLDVFAYAVMSNHLHVVVRNRPDLAAHWSKHDVARRWLQIFPRNRSSDGTPLKPNDVEMRHITSDPARVTELRSRLSSISWFMRSLNEHIARRANHEDECRGRFWEGRFKCQALLDEAAMLTCMAYVDLNPVRAKLAESLEDACFTSALDRIQARQGRQRVRRARQRRQEQDEWLSPRQEALYRKELARSRQARWLAKLDAVDSPLAHVTEAFYLDLLDWTGRQLRADTPGAIPCHIAPVLDQLRINTDRWADTVDRYGSLFSRIAGRFESMAHAARAIGQRWLHGIATSREVFALNPEPSLAPP